jgi:hypothetical protein
LILTLFSIQQGLTCSSSIVPNHRVISLVKKIATAFFVIVLVLVAQTQIDWNTQIRNRPSPNVAVTNNPNPIAGTYRVTADQTITATGAINQNIPGLSWTFPANTALNVNFSCVIMYSQTTAAALDGFGVQDVTIGPTNLGVNTIMYVGLSGTQIDAATNSASPGTGVITLVTGTPSAATTVFAAYISGVIEQPSNASTSVFNIVAGFTTNNGTIKRGSSCQLF